MIALKEKQIGKVVLNRDERKIDLSFEGGEEKWIKVSLIWDNAYDDYECCDRPHTDQTLQFI